MHNSEIKVSVCEDCKLPYSESASHVCSALPPAIEDPYINLLINGRFRIEEPIGIGGWSMVYRARDEKLGRPVAVKLLHLPLASDLEKRRRFENEARAASRLSHPNIVATYDYGLTPMGQPYIVMEHLEGETLGESIKRKGKMPIADAVEMFRQAAEGLAYAHFRGLVHRDIKPSNLFITDGTVGGCTLKIVDFGLAKSLGPPEEVSEITSTGQTIGSPAYMSPEQCMGERLDARSDVYSLACSMFEAIAGVKPFAGNPMECMSAHVGGAIPSFSTVDPDLSVPVELELAIAKGLAKRREERYQTALDFRDAITAGAKGRRPRVPTFTRFFRKYKSPQGKFYRWGVRAIVYGAVLFATYHAFGEPFFMKMIGLEELKPEMLKDDNELAFHARGIEEVEGQEAGLLFLQEMQDHRMGKQGALSPQAGAVSMLLGEYYEQRKNPQYAYFYYKHAAQCLSAGHDSGAYAESLGRLAEIGLDTGHYAQSLKAAKELENLERRQFGEESQQLANALDLKRAVMQRMRSAGVLPSSLKDNDSTAGHGGKHDRRHEAKGQHKHHAK